MNQDRAANPAIAVAPAAAALETPDFDTYPTVHRIAAARPIAGGVCVLWEDGLQSRFHTLWLRENSADPQTLHPVTREQSLMLTDIPEDLAAETAEVEPGGGLWVRWSHGEGESRYHPG